MMKRVTRSVVETSSSTTKCGPFSMAGVASSLPLSTGGVSNVDGTATAYAGTAITTTRIRSIDIGIVTLRRLVEALDVARLPRLVDGGFRGPAGQLARHRAGQDEGGIRQTFGTSAARLRPQPQCTPMWAFASASRSAFLSSGVNFSGSRITTNFLSVPVKANGILLT